MTKVEKLRQLMIRESVEAYLIPNNDEFQNEYLPDSAKRLEFLTGFTGSAGTAVIGLEKAAFFTDGRYTLQAADEVDAEIFKVYNISDKTPSEWCAAEDLNPSYDPKLITIAQHEKLGGKALDKNLVDELWSDRPVPPLKKAEIFPMKYAGKSHQNKIAEIAAGLQADAALITVADSVNWLFNIRGSDIPYTPFCLAYALVHKSGVAELFIDQAKLTDEVRAHLSGVEIKDLDSVADINAESIQLDPATCPLALADGLDCEIVEATDPCQLPKSIKNEAEIAAIIEAHKIDGRAVTKFLKWLPGQDGLNEISAAEKLLEFRKESAEFIQPSFTTISGFGPNGAVIHYNVSRETSLNFSINNLYLVDSGGQYLGESSGEKSCGTTDVTRTIAIGEPSEEMRHNYTLVLKGHIALAKAEFEPGTTGYDLDHLARKPLQDEGKDYDHGTGHGVGCYLSVHEGPCGISKRENPTALQPGMILSNEPGFYKEGEYGIRIENLVLVVEKENGKLGFETLTLAPLDESLIEWDNLTNEEVQWIKDYHERVSKNV